MYCMNVHIALWKKHSLVGWMAPVYIQTGTRTVPTTHYRIRKRRVRWREQEVVVAGNWVLQWRILLLPPFHSILVPCFTWVSSPVPLRSFLFLRLLFSVPPPFSLGGGGSSSRVSTLAASINNILLTYHHSVTSQLLWASAALLFIWATHALLPHTFTYNKQREFIRSRVQSALPLPCASYQFSGIPLTRLPYRTRHS